MSFTAAIVGAGPAGLMAAEILSAGGAQVTIYDHMPSAGRKFLMAGRGGLNLTHSEPLDAFTARYGAAQNWARSILTEFSPADLIAWAEGLGQETFVGSSGRVFPKAMKASPLLRAWLQRLGRQGVVLRLRHRWTGWRDGALTIDAPDGSVETQPDATILALGGGSWAKLGSDGEWTELLAAQGVAVRPLQASNCGVAVTWSPIFGGRFAGTPLNGIAIECGGERVRGEAVVTAQGLEGGALYPLSPVIRQALERDGHADLHLDLRPEMTGAALAARLSGDRRGESFANVLRKRLALAPVMVNLLREASPAAASLDPPALAGLIKGVPIRATALAPIDRAISTVGGVSLAALRDDLSLSARPDVWVAGEMIDWDAPTGGYLLQLCMASAVFAARRILARMGRAIPKH